MRNLSLGRRHLVNAYEVEAGIGVIAGNGVIHAWARWVWGTTKSALYKYTYLYIYMMRRFAADNPSTLSCIISTARPTAWKPRSALLEGFLLALWPGSIKIRSAGGIFGFPRLVYSPRYSRGGRRGRRLPSPQITSYLRAHTANVYASDTTSAMQHIHNLQTSWTKVWNVSAEELWDVIQSTDNFWFITENIPIHRALSVFCIFLTVWRCTR